MKGRIKLFFCLMVASVPLISYADTFTCTVQCEDVKGNVKEVEIQVSASDKARAEESLIGVIDLSSSKAAKVCRNKGYRGVFIQKGKKIVSCK
jgi:hypothetical protein